MTTRTGREAAAYVNIGGTWATPTWVEITIAKDVTISKSMDKKEDNCRGGAADTFKKYLPGLIDLSVDLEVCHDTAHATWQAIEDAIENQSIIDVLFLDDDIANSGAEGVRFEGHVFEAENSQPLEDALVDSYTFAPSASSTEAPERHVIT